jgi:hypothetical protein
VRSWWFPLILLLAIVLLWVGPSLPGFSTTDATSPAQAPGCTRTLDPGSDPSDALHAAPSGATICLKKGTYPAIEATGVEKSPPVTVRSAPGERAHVKGIYLIDPSGLRFVSLRVTGGVNISPSAADVALVGNEITGTSGIFFFGDYRIGKRVNRLLIKGNFIHDIDYTGAQETGYGYGIEGIGDARNVTIRGNTIKSVAADYIQSASPVGWTVDRNTFLGPSLVFNHPQEHQDLWQIFGGGRKIAFTNNVARHTQTHESLLFQEGAFRKVRVENNLFDHDSRGYTCQIYQSSGLVFRRNTIVGSRWGCLFRDLADSPPGSRYRVERNIFADTREGGDISIEGRAGDWGTYDYNVSSDSSAGGRHSVRRWSPSWAGTKTYAPRGLPLSAGYAVP